MRWWSFFSKAHNIDMSSHWGSWAKCGVCDVARCTYISTWSCWNGRDPHVDSPFPTSLFQRPVRSHVIHWLMWSSEPSLVSWLTLVKPWVKPDVQDRCEKFVQGRRSTNRAVVTSILLVALFGNHFYSYFSPGLRCAVVLSYHFIEDLS